MHASKNYVVITNFTVLCQKNRCPKCNSLESVVKRGFKKLKHGNRYLKYQKYLCKDCNHNFVPQKQKASKYDSIALQAQITFEYLLNRSLRKVKTSNAVGRIGKDTILKTVIETAHTLPSTQALNTTLNIVWSGRYMLDALFFKVSGESRALLIICDAQSLDLIDYEIASTENYETWHAFLSRIQHHLSLPNEGVFFVSDGKKAYIRR